MRIFNFFILFSVLVIAGLAVTWFSKTIYNESINQQLAFIEKQSGQHKLRFERDVVQSGLFGFSDRIVVQLSTTDNVTTEPQWVFLLNSECSAIPFYVSCNVRIKGDPEFANVLEEFLPGLTSLSYELVTSVNALTSTINTTFSSQRQHIDATDYQITFKPLVIKGSASLDMTEIQTMVKWQGGSWRTGELFGEVTALSLTSSSSTDKHEFYLGSGEVLLEKFDIGNDEVRYTGTNLSMRTKTTSNGAESYAISQQIGQSSLVVKRENELTVKDISLKVAINGLSDNAMRYLGSSEKPSHFKDADLTSIVNALGEDALTIPVDSLSAQFNGKKISASGELTIAPFSHSDLQQGTFRKGLDGQFRVDIESGVEKVLPELKPMLDAFLSKGYMSIDEKGNVATNLVVNKGKILANGLALPL